jgi:hypothetical protein
MLRVPSWTVGTQLEMARTRLLDNVDASGWKEVVEDGTKPPERYAQGVSALRRTQRGR